MFARVCIVLQRAEGAIMVPTDALVEKDGRTVVYVVGDDGVAHERGVEPGIVKGARTQVVGELRAGELVAVTGHDRLREGLAVRAGRQSSRAETG
jgi:multidrug efflux pump subunit AcrA (membrane-fusion protein)